MNKFLVHHVAEDWQLVRCVEDQEGYFLLADTAIKLPELAKRINDVGPDLTKKNTFLYERWKSRFSRKKYIIYFVYQTFVLSKDPTFDHRMIQLKNFTLE